MIALDRLGYSEAWIGEHFTSQWENIPCPDLFIAQALALTKQIVFGTGVSCLPNHNPLMLAQRIAQLDQMAQGRFRWGVGSGGFCGDFELFDIDVERMEQRQLTRDVLDAVLALWDDPQPGLVEHAALALPGAGTSGRHRPRAPSAPLPATRIRPSPWRGSGRAPTC